MKLNHTFKIAHGVPHKISSGTLRESDKAQASKYTLIKKSIKMKFKNKFMKKIMYVLIFGFLISECGAKNHASGAAKKSDIALEKMIHEIDERQESRLNEAFLPNENGHFSGIHKTYHSNGNIKSETMYKNGKQNGLAIWWDAPGQKGRERNYIDGKLNGLETEFHVNGQKMIETNYKNGKKDGSETFWYKGRENKSLFKDGKEIDLDVMAMQEIKNRCQIQMGEHGFAIVKACVDQDFEALHALQLGLYIEKHEAITTRCTNKMKGHGWAIVKACADQDIGAEDALRKY